MTRQEPGRIEIESREVGQGFGRRGKRSDSENDSKATCPRTFQLSVKVRNRAGSGNHQPISLSAPTRAGHRPLCPHCAPIVIGYQRYFCLNRRTDGVSPRACPRIPGSEEITGIEKSMRREAITSSYSIILRCDWNGRILLSLVSVFSTLGWFWEFCSRLKMWKWSYVVSRIVLIIKLFVYIYIYPCN